MANIAIIAGVKDITRNLKLRGAAMALGVENGLKVAGARLQRESQLRVPVDLGNLKASAFTRASGHGFRTVVNVGYTAAYAVYVHELVGMKLKGQPRPKPRKGKYWDPQGRAQAKFLEEPARRFGPELKVIVKAFTRIH